MHNQYAKKIKKIDNDLNDYWSKKEDDLELKLLVDSSLINIRFRDIRSMPQRQNYEKERGSVNNKEDMMRISKHKQEVESTATLTMHQTTKDLIILSQTLSTSKLASPIHTL